MFHDMDYYSELYSEFDKLIADFKQSLISAVKQEHQEEMNRLREENARLQSVKNDWEKIKEERRADHEELKRKMKESDRKSLKELLDSSALLVMWKVGSARIEKDKCDKCDEQRRIYYTTPRGKRTYEECECQDSAYNYFPCEALRYEFGQKDRERTVIAWYKKMERYSGHACLEDWSTVGDLNADQKPFDEITQYDAVFKDKEKCQEYCDWLNERENKK